MAKTKTSKKFQFFQNYANFDSFFVLAITFDRNMQIWLNFFYSDCSFHKLQNFVKNFLKKFSAGPRIPFFWNLDIMNLFGSGVR